MDCKKSEQYILNYFVEDSSNDIKHELFGHLNSCNKCRQLYIQYRELLDSAKFIKNEEPRSELLNRVSEIARINSSKTIKNESAWRKLFHTPVLVPVFGAAIMFMIIVNVGNESINYLSGDNIEVAINSELDNGEKEGSIEYIDSEINSETETNEDKSNLVAKAGFGNDNSRQLRVSGVNSNHNPIRVSKPIFIKNVGNQLFEAESTLIANANPEFISINSQTLDVSNEFATRSNKIIKTDNRYDVTYDLNKISYESDLTVDHINTSRDKFSQYSSAETSQSLECNRKIAENLNVLNSVPAASFPVRKKAYQNLAECYEVQKEWKYAVEAYYYLTNMDKENFEMYSDRINYIEKNYLQ